MPADYIKSIILSTFKSLRELFWEIYSVSQIKYVTGSCAAQLSISRIL